MLGLAQRAGRLKSGSFLVEESIQKHHARLVILTEDAQGGTARSIMSKCTFYHVPVLRYGTSESMGHAIGKELRSCVSVEDEGFAEKIKTLIGSED